MPGLLGRANDKLSCAPEILSMPCLQGRADEDDNEGETNIFDLKVADDNIEVMMKNKKY